MLNHQERITADDTFETSVLKLSLDPDGSQNPNAITVLKEMGRIANKVDPMSAGICGVMVSLDIRKIYGSEIWVLFDKVCKQDITLTMAVLRGDGLGLVEGSALHDVIDAARNGKRFDLVPEKVLADVQKRRPEFAYFLSIPPPQSTRMKHQ